MNYENTKKGIKYLYYASLFMIVSNLSLLFTSSQNETLKTITNVLAIIGLIGYILSLIGVRVCSKDDSGYHQAYIFAIIGLIVGIIGYVIALIVKIDWISDCTKTITNFCDFMIVWQVLFTSSYILNKLDKKQLADSAIKTSYLFLGCFIATIIYLCYCNSSGVVSNIMNSSILSLLVSAIGIIGTIKYFLFLRKMKKEI